MADFSLLSVSWKSEKGTLIFVSKVTVFYRNASCGYIRNRNNIITLGGHSFISML